MEVVEVIKFSPKSTHINKILAAVGLIFVTITIVITLIFILPSKESQLISVERHNISLATGGNTPSTGKRFQNSIGICLSGGGYRAMLFHVGALRRINELGLLRQAEFISSVSGGSIVAAKIALVWDQLDFDKNGVAKKFDTLVMEPILALSEETIDWKAVLKGIFLRTGSANEVVKKLDALLYQGAKLHSFPRSIGGRAPRFLINATNAAAGTSWMFTRDTMGSNTTGFFNSPNVEVAVAVAASAAFPPVLAPLWLDLTAYLSYQYDLEPYAAGAWGDPSIEFLKDQQKLGLNKEIWRLIADKGSWERISYNPYALEALQNNKYRIPLIDGGVFDNRGLHGCGVYSFNRSKVDNFVRPIILDASIPFKIDHYENGMGWMDSLSRSIDLIMSAGDLRYDFTIMNEINSVIKDWSQEKNTEKKYTKLSKDIYTSSVVATTWPYYIGLSAKHINNSVEVVKPPLLDGNPNHGQGYWPNDILPVKSNKEIYSARELASIPTRLASLSQQVSTHVINTGYLLTHLELLEQANMQFMKSIHQNTISNNDHKILLDSFKTSKFQLPYVWQTKDKLKEQ